MEEVDSSKAELASLLAEVRAEREEIARMRKEAEDEKIRIQVEADRGREDLKRRVDREKRRWRRLNAEREEEKKVAEAERKKEKEEAERKEKEREEAEEKRKEEEKEKKRKEEEKEKKRKEEEKEKKRKEEEEARRKEEEEEARRKEEEEKEAKKPRQRDYHWKRPYDDEEDEENIDETEFRFEGRLLPPAMRKMAAAALQKTKDAADMKHHLCHVMSARKIECRLRKRGVMEVHSVLLSLGFQIGRNRHKVSFFPIYTREKKVEVHSFLISVVRVRHRRFLLFFSFLKKS